MGTSDSTSNPEQTLSQTLPKIGRSSFQRCHLPSLIPSPDHPQVTKHMGNGTLEQVFHG